MKFITLLFLLASCANIKSYQTYKEKLPYFQFKKNNEEPNSKLRALRDKEHKIITSPEKAKDVLEKIPSVDHLKKLPPKPCPDDVQLSKDYHHAISLLENKKHTQARDLLLKLSAKCKNLKYTSHINYLIAYSYQLEGNSEKRNSHLQEFVDFAEYIYPPGLYQENSFDEQREIYAKYYNHALQTQSGSELELKPIDMDHLSIVRYKSLRNSLLPGFESDTGENFTIFVGYSTATKGFIESGYNFVTPYGEFTPAVMLSEPLGSNYTLHYRKSLTQSLDRKHQTGMNLGLYQWKHFTYSFNTNTRFRRNYKITREGIGKYAAYGGTYQFNNAFNFVYQAKFVSAYRDNLVASTLLGFNVAKISQLQCGILDNHSVFGLKIAPIYLYYNFSIQSVVFSLSKGYSF